MKLPSDSSSNRVCAACETWFVGSPIVRVAQVSVTEVVRHSSVTLSKWMSILSLIIGNVDDRIFVPLVDDYWLRHVIWGRDVTVEVDV
jgi:hypothetical protein